MSRAQAVARECGFLPDAAGGGEERLSPVPALPAYGTTRRGRAGEAGGEASGQRQRGRFGAPRPDRCSIARFDRETAPRLSPRYRTIAARIRARRAPGEIQEDAARWGGHFGSTLRLRLRLAEPRV